MKQVFTLLATALLASFVSNAQFTENFENSLPSGCWLIDQVNYTNINPDVITGNGSIYTNPPTSGSSLRTISTPFLNFSSSTFSVAFNYSLNARINANTTRTIEVGLVDRMGSFTSLDVITLSSGIPKNEVQAYSKSLPVSMGTYRLSIRMGGATGSGGSRLIMDDLSVSATPYYTTVGHCNGSPIAVNDIFNIASIKPVTGYVMTNDSDPDNETISAYIVTQPDVLKGSVTLNSTDGQFTFTPAPGFTGGTVTFTYNVIDNGYSSNTSNTATVTLNFPEIVVLPVHLISFNGNLTNDKAQLTWLVAGNETGEGFEIERSDDGKSFTTEALMFTTKKFASETYTYKSSKTVTGPTYYRLKIINKDGSVDHSRTIVLKTAKAGNNNKLLILQNPVENTLMFHYTATTSNTSTVTIYNTSGARMLTTRVKIQTGTNALSINLDGRFTSGTYLLEVINGTERTVSKLIKK